MNQIDKKEIDNILAIYFWDLQCQLSAVSAIIPDYDIACDRLEIDPAKSILTIVNISGMTNILVFKKGQITDVVWILDQEASKLAGDMIADDCGLDKTILALAHIDFAYRIQLLCCITDPIVEFRFIFIFCPAGIVDIWYTEFKILFEGRLIFRQFYENQKDHTGIHKAIVINKNQGLCSLFFD